MNKTGPQLLGLSPEEGFSIQEKYVAADSLYSQIKEDVKKRAVALDEAISQSTQVMTCTRYTVGFFQTAERGETFPGISGLNFNENHFTTLSLSIAVFISRRWCLLESSPYISLPACRYNKKQFSVTWEIQLSTLPKYLKESVQNRMQYLPLGEIKGSVIITMKEALLRRQ